MKKSIFLFAILFLFCSFEAFCGPFGIDFGMTLEQVRRACKITPEDIGDGWYIITPPNTHELFEVYLIQIHPRYGVYFIKAISKDISTNRHGTELLSRFDNLISNIEKIYGKYLKKDQIKSESNYKESRYFMYTLENGDRELIVFWDREEMSKMPDDMEAIIVYTEAENTSRGFIVIEYYSINYNKIEAEQSSVF